ncbi:hypothetical protein LTSERUB_3632 [Salmonella enterica subsp. enterica serovar Rubislaw str. A4-653]|uniref:Uncharacterized protein n=1 Tax=Salmonella enterica subsp. enterica serovar Rubislaw str. A4-653 TaxID=913081 RepID=G5QLI8_SALRU|nr:hypothetical protein LTSERUB_3632 [Salmonella enterica subsp. enterica serovar Rubislaw str. A4-653]
MTIRAGWQKKYVIRSATRHPSTVSGRNKIGKIAPTDGKGRNKIAPTDGKVIFG